MLIKAKFSFNCRCIMPIVVGIEVAIITIRSLRLTIVCDTRLNKSGVTLGAMSNDASLFKYPGNLDSMFAWFFQHSSSAILSSGTPTICRVLLGPSWRYRAGLNVTCLCMVRCSNCGSVLSKSTFENVLRVSGIPNSRVINVIPIGSFMPWRSFTIFARRWYNKRNRRWSDENLTIIYFEEDRWKRNKIGLKDL